MTGEPRCGECHHEMERHALLYESGGCSECDCLNSRIPTAGHACTRPEGCASPEACVSLSLCCWSGISFTEVPAELRGIAAASRRLTDDEIRQWAEDGEYPTVQRMAEEYLALRAGLEPLRDHPTAGGPIRILLDGEA